MQPLRKLWPEIGLLVLLIVFVALKFPDLSLPYFWDEIGVYAPGALRMHDAQISLMPAALDPEYSRGHPLLAVVFYASWMRIFGDGVVPAHAATLALACATLAAQYFGTRQILGKPGALLGAVFTAVQPIFWAMSGVVLPEMLLTLFTVACLYGLVRPRLWVYVLAGSGAVLTKESGLTVPAAACLFFFLEGLARRDLLTTRRWVRIAAGAAPVAVFGLFLLVQKAQNGWYFFPYHIGFIDLSPSHIWHATTHALHDVFFQQGRWLVGLLALTALPLAWRRRRVDAVPVRAVWLAGLLIAGAVGFAVINFYLTRYLVYIIPIVSMAAAWTVSVLAARLQSARRLGVFGIAAAVAIILGITNLGGRGFQDTSDMSYVAVVRSKQAALSWAQAQPWRDSRVGANFPVFQALQDPRFGYIEQPWPYSENCAEPTQYAIVWHHTDEEPPLPEGRPARIIRKFCEEYSCVSIVRFQ